MDDLDDEQKSALDRFNSELEARGASYIRTENGDVIFAFKRPKVEEFLKQMDESGKDRIMILIQKNGSAVN